MAKGIGTRYTGSKEIIGSGIYGCGKRDLQNFKPGRHLGHIRRLGEREVQERVFKQEYGVDRIDPERLMQKFKVSTNELVRQAKMQRKLGIEQKAKAEGFNAAIKNKPTQSLSSAGITGQVIKPKVTNLAMVSDAELQNIIEGN